MDRTQKKALVTERIELSVYALRRDGFLKPGSFITRRCQGNILRFTIGEDKLTICADDWTPKYNISLTKTPCARGGERFWFTCPACKQRKAILYARLDHKFACRDCSDLSYESKNLSDAWNLLHQAQKIQKKLGWHGPDGERPKWMHETTYQRLVDKHDDYDRRAMFAMAKALKL